MVPASSAKLSTKSRVTTPAVLLAQDVAMVAAHWLNRAHRRRKSNGTASVFLFLFFGFCFSELMSLDERAGQHIDKTIRRKDASGAAPPRDAARPTSTGRPRCMQLTHPLLPPVFSLLLSLPCSLCPLSLCLTRGAPRRRTRSWRGHSCSASSSTKVVLRRAAVSRCRGPGQLVGAPRRRGRRAAAPWAAAAGAGAAAGTRGGRRRERYPPTVASVAQAPRWRGALEREAPRLRLVVKKAKWRGQWSCR